MLFAIVYFLSLPSVYQFACLSNVLSSEACDIYRPCINRCKLYSLKLDKGIVAEFLVEIKSGGSEFRGLSEGGTHKLLDRTRLNFHKHYCLELVPGKCVEIIVRL